MRTSLLATLVLVGCGGSPAANDARGSGSPDSPNGDFDAPPTFGARMPQVIAMDTTDIMLTPKGMAITWNDDPNQASIEKFFGEYGSSSAWATQTSEYGVGALTAATPQHMTGTHPKTTTSDALLNILQTNLTGASPAWGAPDANTIYMFFVPVGTEVNDGSGNVSCTDYDGYHFDEMIGGVDVAYSIAAACDDEAKGEGISDLDDLMITAGHETLEAATDPRTALVDNIGWGNVDDAHSAFEYITEGEVADMCEFAATQDWVAPPSMDFSIQRTWSNKVASAGHDPCVGDGTTPYYQSIPDDGDLGVVDYEGFSQNTAGTKVAVGGSGTINFTLYSDVASAGPFTVQIYDEDGTYDDQGNDTDPLLTFTSPSGMFKPGDRISIPVNVLKVDPNVTGAEPYEIDTTPVGGGPTTAWYAWVLQ